MYISLFLKHMKNNLFPFVFLGRLKFLLENPNSQKADPNYPSYILSTKMSLERPATSSSSCTEIDNIILPEEVWIMIWSNLDFKTVQKTCTRVSKFWLKIIRSSKLSCEMKLRRTS